MGAWRRGINEWNEGKGDLLYNVVELFKREVIKATDQLYKLIVSSDVLLILRVNRKDLEMLGPKFLRLL